MDTPVSKFTYGMNECNNYLNKKEYYINEAFEDITPKKKYGLVTSNCDYEFDENEISLIFFVGEKAQSGGFIPKTDLKNNFRKQKVLFKKPR